MPMPKLFKSSSPKTDTSTRSFSAVVPTKAKDVAQQTAITSNNGTLGSSGGLKGVLGAAPQEQGTEKLLNRLGTPIITPSLAPSLVYLSFDTDPERKANVQSTLIPLPGQQTVAMKPSMDTPQIAEAIQKGVDTFLESVPPLLEALGEVEKIHPFVSGTISFFGSSQRYLMVVYPAKSLLLRSGLCTLSKVNDVRTTREFWRSARRRVESHLHLNLTNSRMKEMMEIIVRCVAFNIATSPHTSLTGRLSV